MPRFERQILNSLRGTAGLPKELTRLWAILGKGLEASESLRPDVHAAFGSIWVFAAVLTDQKGATDACVRPRHLTTCCRLTGALGHLR